MGSPIFDCHKVTLWKFGWLVDLLEHSYRFLLFSDIASQIDYMSVNAVNLSGFLVLELVCVGHETDVALGSAL